MKYQPSALSLIFTIVCFTSCNRHDSAIPKQNSLAKERNQSLAGQLYLFAPEYDSTYFVATGACDCCSANTLFLDDSVFLNIDYCEDGCSYIKGTYHMQHDELEMHFDSLTVEKLYPEYDENDSIGNISPDFTYHTVMNKPDLRTYKKQDYKGHTILKGMHEFGAIDTGGTTAAMMKGIQAEGIWDRLIGKTKVVNQHSPAAAMPDLLGVWAGTGDQNASFEIQESTIYYPDASREYKYTLEHDSIKIKYGNYEGAFAVKMNGTDTLIFDGHERQVLHRFKD